MYFQEGKTDYGGIFSLSPDSNPAVSPFPRGYISLVSDRFDYLLEAPEKLCVSSYHLGLGSRYDNGILCKAPLRALKIYTRGLKDDGSAPKLKLEVWYGSRGIADHATTRPTTVSMIPFHRISNSKKQGYSLPVFPMEDVSYRLSLTGSSKFIPEDWVIEFSDPVVGNRWGEEFIMLDLMGRYCGPGGLVSSQHDRRFLYSGLEFMPPDTWGNHGACVRHNNRSPSPMPSISCDRTPQLEASSCPELCPDGCGSGSYCDCRTATCQCEVGFWGDDCSIDLCQDSCGSHSTCAGKYLGGTLPIHSVERACIDRPSGSPTRLLWGDDDELGAWTRDISSGNSSPVSLVSLGAFVLVGLCLLLAGI